MQRRKVFYSGDVQGVGFRFNAHRVAADFDVGGYVKNLSDGRVELVAEGEQAELEAFLGKLSEVMAGYIQDFEVEVSEDVEQQWAGFRIMH